jgi:hypothetical protein
MKIEYTLALADYKAALKLHARQSILRRAGSVLLYAIFAMALVGSLACILLRIGGKAELATALFDVDAWLAVFALYLYLLRVFTVRRGFKRIWPARSGDHTVAMEIDGEGIRSSLVGVSEGKFFWNAIVRFAQDEKITLLYLGKTRFLFIPTQSMSQEQRNELKDLVARHIAKK